MNRSFSCSAIILNIKENSNNNATVSILTKDNGVIYATMYGGAKSRFKSIISPYNTGKINLYENPEKNQTKITDFEVENFHLSFSNSLYKTFAAALATEIIIKTHCAASYEQSFLLLQGFLDGMELCNEEQCKLGLLRFLWRYLELLGIQPEIENCNFCSKDFFKLPFTINSVFYYNISNNFFICEQCFTQNNSTSNSTFSNSFRLSYNALFYLYGISNFLPKDSRNLHITKIEYEQIKQLIFFLIENNISTKLNSLETSCGIL